MSNASREQYMQTKCNRTSGKELPHKHYYWMSVIIWPSWSAMLIHLCWHLVQNLYPVCVYCKGSRSLSENIHSERNLPSENVFQTVKTFLSKSCPLKCWYCWYVPCSALSILFSLIQIASTTSLTTVSLGRISYKVWV